MEGWRDRWMGEWMEGEKEGGGRWRERSRGRDRGIDGQRDRWREGWREGGIDGWIDRQTDRLMDRWNGQKGGRERTKQMCVCKFEVEVQTAIPHLLKQPCSSNVQYCLKFTSIVKLHSLASLTLKPVQRVSIYQVKVFVCMQMYVYLHVHF